jgi:hypothetical protein
MVDVLQQRLLRLLRLLRKELSLTGMARGEIMLELVVQCGSSKTGKQQYCHC